MYNKNWYFFEVEKHRGEPHIFHKRIYNKD